VFKGLRRGAGGRGRQMAARHGTTVIASKRRGGKGRGKGKSASEDPHPTAELRLRLAATAEQRGSGCDGD
jgi:hypothetical protein